ncbi:MAG: hypothetical protein M0R46_16920 [Candidatus Muirbacterium halophilum]|nr:hypothetical protein [Candidatus Muirbacterium halophilum]
MKITRTTIISDQKEQKPDSWSAYKHYHKIEINFYKDELRINKELWYITGHGSEQVDEIFIRSSHNAIYKTQTIENLTKEIEDEMVEKLIEYNKEKIQDKLDDIEAIKNDIKNYNKNIKDLKGYKPAQREEKLERILKNERN